MTPRIIPLHINSEKQHTLSHELWDAGYSFCTQAWAVLWSRYTLLSLLTCVLILRYFPENTHQSLTKTVS